MLLLASCSFTSPIEEMTIKRIYVYSREELRKYCGDSLFQNPLGCAKVSGKHCTIVAFKPNDFDDEEKLKTLGHELVHCFDGPIHK